MNLHNDSHALNGAKIFYVVTSTTALPGLIQTLKIDYENSLVAVLFHYEAERKKLLEIVCGRASEQKINY